MDKAKIITKCGRTMLVIDVTEDKDLAYIWHKFNKAHVSLIDKERDKTYFKDTRYNRKATFSSDFGTNTWKQLNSAAIKRGMR